MLGNGNGARGVGSQPFRCSMSCGRIAVRQRRLEIGRRREQRALDRAAMPLRPVNDHHHARAVRDEDNRAFDLAAAIGRASRPRRRRTACRSPFAAPTAHWAASARASVCQWSGTWPRRPGTNRIVGESEDRGSRCASLHVMRTVQEDGCRVALTRSQRRPPRPSADSPGSSSCRACRRWSWESHRRSGRGRGSRSARSRRAPRARRRGGRSPPPSGHRLRS